MPVRSFEPVALSSIPIPSLSPRAEPGFLREVTRAHANAKVNVSLTGTTLTLTLTLTPTPSQILP